MVRIIQPYRRAGYDNAWAELNAGENSCKLNHRCRHTGEGMNLAKLARLFFQAGDFITEENKPTNGSCIRNWTESPIVPGFITLSFRGGFPGSLSLCLRRGSTQALCIGKGWGHTPPPHPLHPLPQAHRPGSDSSSPDILIPARPLHPGGQAGGQPGSLRQKRS
jgi:hypothetical protein